MCIAGAIIGAAVIGAAGTAIAGHQAAQATQGATNAAINEQQNALSQQAQLSAPYRALGQANIPTLQALLTPGSNQTDMLRSLPGYQFAQQQGTQNTVNQATAMGMGLSGNTLQALSQFNTGLADQTFQQEIGNLQNVVGMGQAAAAGQAANIGNAAGNISGALINQGNNLAGISANTIAGMTRAFGNAGNQYVMYNTLQNLMNPTDLSTLGSGQSYTSAGMDTLAQQGVIGPGSVADIIPTG